MRGSVSPLPLKDSQDVEEGATKLKANVGTSNTRTDIYEPDDEYECCKVWWGCFTCDTHGFEDVICRSGRGVRQERRTR